MMQQGAQPGSLTAVSRQRPVRCRPSQGDEMMDGMDMGMDRSKMSFFERLLDWFGRLHPMVVHFPIAFFPAALVHGHRRAAAALIRDPCSISCRGWRNIRADRGGCWLARRDRLRSGSDSFYHRWLGVAIGFAGAGLGLWAWRRPWEDRGTGMILALTIMTIAIAVQGFLGAGLTHGMEHMMF